MRTRACLLFLFAVHAPAHAAGAVVSPDEIAKADAAIAEIKGDDFDAREKAARALTALFKPATEARLNFWEAWLRKQIDASKDQPDAVARIRELAPTEDLEITDAQNYQWKVPVYSRPGGQPVVHGDVTESFNAGLTYKLSFKHGLFDGEYVQFYSNFDGHTNIPKVREWCQNGSVTGYRKTYHPNGALALSGNQIDGCDDGEFIGYDKTGVETGRFNMKHGTGTYRNWHPNGRLQAVLDLVEMLPSGTYERWGEDGKPIQRSHFKYDPNTKTSLPDGTWEGWDEDAKEKVVDLRFENGVPMEGRARIKEGNGDVYVPQWLVFEKGRAHIEDHEAMGDYKGHISVAWYTMPGGEVVFKDSQIWSGSFLNVYFKDGKPVGEPRRKDPETYFAEELAELLAKYPTKN